MKPWNVQWWEIVAGTLAWREDNNNAVWDGFGSFFLESATVIC